MRAILIMLTLLIACGPTFSLDLYRVEPAFVGYDDEGEYSYAWRDKLKMSAAVWAEALGPTCPVPFVVDDDGLERDALTATLYAPEVWPHASDETGYAIHAASMIDIRGPRGGHAIGIVVDILLHEYGHIIGLEHVEDDETSVMFPKAIALVPNADDAHRARELLGCL